MSKREQGFGSVGSGAAAALDAGRETSDRREKDPCALLPSVIEVARQHDVHPNLLTVWRRQARTGSIGSREGAAAGEPRCNLAAVSVAPEPSAWAACAGAGGTIEIAFTSGIQLRDHRRGRSRDVDGGGGCAVGWTGPMIPLPSRCG